MTTLEVFLSIFTEQNEILLAYVIVTKNAKKTNLTEFLLLNTLNKDIYWQNFCLNDEVVIQSLNLISDYWSDK